jgi:hypothetical protein
MKSVIQFVKVAERTFLAELEALFATLPHCAFCGEL